MSTYLNGPDLNSLSNSYTISNPITVYQSVPYTNNPTGFARWWSIGDKIVSTSSISSTVPTMPGTPAVPANFATNSMDVSTTNTAAQINALFASPSGWAWTKKGQQPVVHFPAGTYNINQTLVIPAGLDVQLVGDCRGSVLNWTGPASGTMLQLDGPSKAHLYELNLAGNGSGPATAIMITKPDQVGAKIYVEEGIWQGFSNYGPVSYTHLDVYKRQV